VIVSFRHKGLKLLYETSSVRGVQAQHKLKLELILFALDTAESADDLSQALKRKQPKVVPFVWSSKAA
jgi:proteic killer suppression protein